MAHGNSADRNELDDINDIYRLGDLLTEVYRDSDYRFGCLHFAEPMGDGNYPDFIVEPPDFMKSGWTWNHEVPMVLHPAKGALLLTTTWLPQDASSAEHTADLEQDHSELVALEWKIRRRLESIGYWKDRAIVLGVGLVSAQHVADDVRPQNVPEVAVIDRDKLPQLARHVDALFDHYTTDAARPVSEWGERLVNDITGSELLGDFVDEESHFENYDEWGRDLEGLVERAA